MGIRNQGREELKRLASKTLDARFVRELTEGLNCSRFEAEAARWASGCFSAASGPKGEKLARYPTADLKV